MKFIHAADLHIDSPMRGLDAYAGSPVERLRGATRRALIALVDLALREEVDLVLLVGDVFDRDLGDFHAAMFFRQQMIRLTGSGIRVFVVKGNHDAEGQIGKKLPEVAGLHVFGSRTGEVVDILELETAVHGRSFTEREVREDLVPSYKSALPGRFNIGLLHTSLTGRTGHEPYAPTDVATLSAKGYDYFALGHVHMREVVQEANPRIVFPGNLQGRHVGETGSKGCELVTVDGGRIVASAHVSLDVVRWHQIVISAEGLETLTQLAIRFQEACSALVVSLEDRLHVLRVTVEGASMLHAEESVEPGTLAASLQAATQEFTAADLWIESVRLNMSSPIDRSSLAEREDAVGEVMRLIVELRADDARLEDWVRQSLDKMPVLPSELLDTDPLRLTLDNLKSLLADAETTVLSKLAAAGG